MGYVKQRINLYLLLILLITVSITVSSCGKADIESDLDLHIKTTAQYLVKEVPEPAPGDIGGEWRVIGIYQSGIKDSKKYGKQYIINLKKILKAKEGKLNVEYASAYARISLCLGLLGENPKEVDGYNLFLPLESKDEFLELGCTAMSYALVASNVSGEKLAAEDVYISGIISDLAERKNMDYLSDYFSMSLVGLSFYKDKREDVNNAIKRYVAKISELQQEDGSMGNCDSTAEAVIGLCQIGINPHKDKRFVKNGHSLIDGLGLFADDKGGFFHKEGDEKINPMSTEKALLAMEAYRLYRDERSCLYKKIK